ncbi:hypothetical protein CNMCM6805_005164 [Aspergillus fumigatiaffinis]|uniref:Histidinol phosphate phosphatase n=1 Tax=Aspergillus fumigatiaffinis TaxID=340414 RepID=A0A8H4M1U6_9EURO|nr:hypothetical protein CNMCM5878_005780 [Aspergillus fumigatiaffinis]KAF4226047.1 hypothetical protein CNMCM6805_005164 [Aspergillus fumigatiaffinis]
MAIEFTQAQLDEIYAFAVDLGRKAGDLLLERIDRQIASDGETAYAYTEKDNAVDIVTQTDEDVETFIKTAIEKRYPEHKFLGEETYAQGQSRSYLIDAHPTWCIDPLDGIRPPATYVGKAAAKLS